jgi:hypothetical protein
MGENRPFSQKALDCLIRELRGKVPINLTSKKFFWMQPALAASLLK